MILRFLFFVWTFCKALSLLAEVSHDEAKMPRRERPQLAGNKALSNEKYRYYINIFIYLFIYYCCYYYYYYYYHTRD